MAGELQLAKGLKTTTNVPADAWRGPYTTVANACTAIPTVMRLYRTVDIITDNGIVEHWWKNGTADNDLVEKQVAGNSLGNWGVDENGVLNNPLDEGNILTNNWSIYQGFFSGRSDIANWADSANFAQEAGYASGAYAANVLSGIWSDDGSNLNSNNTERGISTANWSINQSGNIYGGGWNITSGFFSGTANAAASLYGEWYLDNSYNLTANGVYGIIAPNWSIDENGNFNGQVALANNANLLGGFWDGSSIVSDLRAGASGDYPTPQPASITTQNWNIDTYGNSQFHSLGIWNDDYSSFGLITTNADRGFSFFSPDSVNSDCLISFFENGMVFRQKGGGDCGVDFYTSSLGETFRNYAPKINAKTLAVSVNDNFADSTGNITLPITSDTYTPTIQNLTNIHNTSPNVPIVLCANYTTINNVITASIKLNFQHITNSAVTKFEIAMPTGYVTDSVVAIFNGGIANTAVVGVCTGVTGNQFIEVKFTSLPMGASTQYNLICTYKKQAAI